MVPQPATCLQSVVRKVAWWQVLHFVVQWLDLDDASWLWESGAVVPRFVRSWKRDLEVEFDRRSRSSASAEAARVQRLLDDWAFCGYEWDD